MRVLNLFLVVIFVAIFAAACNHGHSNKDNPKQRPVTETSSYRNGAIMIKDNTSYRDYGKTPESFNSVIKSESETVNIGPDDIRFGQE